MKRNTIYKLCIAGLMAVSLSLLPMSCGKFDQEPQGEWVDGDLSSGSLEGDVFSLYGKMRSSNINAGNVAMAVHSFRSEDAEKGSTASDKPEHGEMYDNFNYTATNSLLSQYYTGNFEMVHAANTAINRYNQIDSSRLTDGDKINNGELHFFRAFAYFNLVRAFGEVPLFDYAVKSREEAIAPKVKVEEIYKLIDADLTIAEASLPQRWDAMFVGRLTWGAARALHARTYMMRNDWEKMHKAATDVINSGIYNLSTPFNEIFREKGENNAGSILEVQCTANDAMKQSGDIGSQFAQVQGVRGAGEWDLGWGWNCPTQLLADAFEAGDPRKDETLLYFLRPGDDPNSIPANTPYGEKPIAQSPVVSKYFNKKAYTDPELRKKYSRFGYWFNIRLIRYSDVLLMAAEAANELGNSTEALNYLEQVRARARGNNSSVLPRVTTTNQSELRDAIRHERRVELAMEYDRFYDLVRWGIDEEVLHRAGKANYNRAKHRYLPLPQTEVDRSNGVLKQLDGY